MERLVPDIEAKEFPPLAHGSPDPLGALWLRGFERSREARDAPNDAKRPSTRGLCGRCAEAPAGRAKAINERGGGPRQQKQAGHRGQRSRNTTGACYCPTNKPVETRDDERCASTAGKGDAPSAPLAHRAL
ncbi:unnamed protein product [Lampetra planeri]